MGKAQERGRAGESLAAAYLELVGCRTVARNMRLGGVEVDLVVYEGSARVVVEVRMRSRADYGGAAATLVSAPAPPADCPPVTAAEMKPIIDREATKNKVDSKLVQAVVEAE